MLAFALVRISMVLAALTIPGGIVGAAVRVLIAGWGTRLPLPTGLRPFVLSIRVILRMAWALHLSLIVVVR